MSDRFDPYHKWLGIPPEERPFSHYRLLGIPLYEPDQEVIAGAAVQRMNWLRKFQSGENGADAKRLSKEIADAWACLLNPQRKQEYDVQLSLQLAGPRRGTEIEFTDGFKRAADSFPLETPPPFLAAEPLQTDYSSIAPAYSPTPVADSPPVAEPPFSSGMFTRPARRPVKAARRKKKQPSILPMMLAPLLGVAMGYVILSQINPQADFLHLFTKQEPAAAAAPQKNTKPTPTPPKPKKESIVPRTAPSQPRPLPTPPPERQRTEEPPVVAPTRLKVPSDDDQQRATAIVAEAYKAEFDSAKSRAQKVALAGKILKDALDTDDAPTQYVALQTAQLLAEAVGEIVVALEIAGEIGKRFEVDPFTEQAAVLARVQFSPEILTRMPLIFSFLETRCEDGLNADRFDFIAGLARFFSKTHQAAAETKPPGGAGDANQIARDLKFAEIFASAAKTFDVLATSPTDGKANTAAGSFLCFVLDKWDFGLLRFANGDDEILREIAKADMTPFMSAEQKVDVADRWMQLADKDEENAWAIKSRAIYWYRSALPQLTGVHKTRIENRIAEIERSLKGFQVEDDVPESPPLVTSPQTARELEQAANQCRTAREALALYQGFLANKDIPDSEKQLATKRMPFWTEIAAKDYRRLGNKWIPPDEFEKANKEIRETMLRAMELFHSNPKETVSLLQKAASTDPEALQIYSLLGLTRAVVEHDYRKARMHFRKCESLEPTNACVLNNIALVSALSGDDSTAISLFRKAMESPPDSGRVFHNISLLAYHSARKTWTVTPAATTAYRKLVDEWRAKGVSDSTGAKGWLFLLPNGSDDKLPYSQLLRGNLPRILIDESWVEDRACVMCSGLAKLKCSECGGRGRVSSRQQVENGRTPDGNIHYRTIVVQESCPGCRGDGTRDCPRCAGGIDPGIR